MSDTLGRTNVIDDTAMETVLTKLSGPIATRKEDFENLMFDAAKDTAVRRGRAKTLVKKPSARTIKRYRIKNKLIFQNVEEITDARYKAVFDIYNAITFAVMNQAIATK